MQFGPLVHDSECPRLNKYSSEEVLWSTSIGTGIERELIQIIEQRKVSYLGHIYLGHILRNNKYVELRFILMEKIEGKRGPGRKQH